MSIGNGLGKSVCVESNVFVGSVDVDRGGVGRGGVPLTLADVHEILFVCWKIFFCIFFCGLRVERLGPVLRSVVDCRVCG